MNNSDKKKLNQNQNNIFNNKIKKDILQENDDIIIEIKNEVKEENIFIEVPDEVKEEVILEEENIFIEVPDEVKEEVILEEVKEELKEENIFIEIPDEVKEDEVKQKVKSKSNLFINIYNYIKKYF